MNPVAQETPLDLPPAITWLNMSGDVTITWDADNREHILTLVRQKMKEGYSFFVLTPRVLPMFGNKKVALTDASQLDRARGVVLSDEVVHAVVGNLGDQAVETAVKTGRAHLAAPGGKRGVFETLRRAFSAEEVVQHQTVAVRPVVGG